MSLNDFVSAFLIGIYVYGVTKYALFFKEAHVCLIWSGNEEIGLRGYSVGTCSYNSCCCRCKAVLQRQILETRRYICSGTERSG